MGIKIILYISLLFIVLCGQLLLFEPESIPMYEFIIKGFYFFLGLLGGYQVIAWITNKLKEDESPWK